MGLFESVHFEVILCSLFFIEKNLVGLAYCFELDGHWIVKNLAFKNMFRVSVILKADLCHYRIFPFM